MSRKHASISQSILYHHPSKISSLKQIRVIMAISSFLLIESYHISVYIAQISLSLLNHSHMYLLARLFGFWHPRIIYRPNHGPCSELVGIAVS